MTIDDDAVVSQPDAMPEIVARLQAQVEDLTEVLGSHQRLFEQLRARGVLAGEDGASA